MAFGKGKNTVQSVENAPKIKKEKVRNANKANRNFGIIGILLVAILACGALFVFRTQKDSTMISVLTLSTSVPQDGLVTKEMFVEKQMSAKDFETFGTYTSSGDNKQTRTTIVKWDERSSVENKYATYYIKAGTPLYWDAIGTESPKQYSYLYNMDGELLKVNLNPNTFGKMLVPGDHINVRATYMETITTLPSYEDYVLQQQMGLTQNNQVERHIMLFNNVSILDMLNSNGDSIFDLYYEVLALPKDQQIEVINSDDFINSVKPASILLNVTPEEADRYMSIQSKSGLNYMMTMLPRTTSNAITELLNELQTGFARKDNK